MKEQKIKRNKKQSEEQTEEEKEQNEIEENEQNEENNFNFNLNERNCLRNELINWYINNRRLLPWRGDIINNNIPPLISAYGILVSEIMLQQTRVETVITYWLKWMNTFPTIESLANSTIEEVNSLWAGLGYYRRVRNLYECAKIIVLKYQGIIPKDIKLLLELPGIGPYTAGAIASIAYNIPSHAVDGNVVRVISRLRAIDSLEGSILEKKCRDIAQDIVDPIQPSLFNQALMEIGATICKPQNPICEQAGGECPLMNFCKAYQNVKLNSSLTADARVGDIEDICVNPITSVTHYPKKTVKKPPIDHKFIIISLHYTSQLNSNSNSADNQQNSIQYLFSRRPETGLLANQWEFPSFEIPVDITIPTSDHWIHAQNKIIRSFETHLLLSDIKIIRQHTTPLIHIFTHQKHHMFLLELTISSQCLPIESFEWMNYHQLTEKGMTTGVKKIFKLLTTKNISTNNDDSNDNSNINHDENYDESILKNSSKTKKRSSKSQSPSINNSNKKKKKSI